MDEKNEMICIRHAEAPCCIDSCLMHTLSRDRATYTIALDEKKRIRCRICVSSCP